MGIPKYYELQKPFLEALKDGSVHKLKDIKKSVINHFNLTEDDLNQLLPSGRQSVFDNRIGWARTYLKNAGLIESPIRASFVITEEGKRVLFESPEVIDDNYLMKYESFKKFKYGSRDNNTLTSTSATDNSDTPDIMFDDAFKQINDSLADDLMSEIMKISPKAFEKMILDLMRKMGYGTFDNAATMTATSGDEGIDGIIYEDKLGFDLIYVQAKQWKVDSSVGRPEIQSFVGAISGKGGKGLFVTTAKFSKPAIDYAKSQHIILIDGEKLTRLMIENNFGVHVEKTFEIKEINENVFGDYSDL